MKLTAAAARRSLRKNVNPEKARFFQKFFKTGPGEYAEGDRFLGLTVPATRAVARTFRQLPLSETIDLLQSPWHEERLLALLILVAQYRQGDETARQRIYAAYMKNLKYVNNWDLVDSSAPGLVGPHLFERDRSALDKLAASPNLWRRRIALMSTFYFIRQGEFQPTLKLVTRLLDDEEDLIHKAAGWMLREIGNRDPGRLRAFLDIYAGRMARTELRYAIEKLPQAQRQRYLKAPRRA